MEEKKKGFFSRLQEGLAKTRKGMVERLEEAFMGYTNVNEELFESLEEILITSDIGMETTMKITEELRQNVREMGIKDPKVVESQLKYILKKIVDKGDAHKLSDKTPLLILMIGVNGSGKTTSIGKLSKKCLEEGKSVLLAAADTFRAAAIDQLQIWGDRTGVNVIKHQEGADPSAVIYDAIQAAKARDIDVLICDTAGRLHNKTNLMNELEKMHKIIEKEYPYAEKEVLLVLDAGTGQNAMLQAKEFGEITNLTGIILTKLDGTAKGGVVISISDMLSIPVKFIGVGESIEDLQEFEPIDFVDALFEKGERNESD